MGMQVNQVLRKRHPGLVVSLPFDETQSVYGRIRTFSAETDPEELVWHRDDEDRIVHVVECDGWYFQRDDGLPVKMQVGDVIHIRRHEWHRVIMRRPSKLVVKILTSSP